MGSLYFYRKILRNKKFSRHIGAISKNGASVSVSDQWRWYFSGWGLSLRLSKNTVEGEVAVFMSPGKASYYKEMGGES